MSIKEKWNLHAYSSCYPNPSNSWKLLESIDKEAKLVAKMSGKPPTQEDKARVQRTQEGKDKEFAGRFQSSADKAAYQASQGNQSKK